MKERLLLLIYIIWKNYFFIDQKIKRIEDLAFQSIGDDENQMKKLNLSSNMIREVSEMTFTYLWQLRTLDIGSEFYFKP